MTPTGTHLATLALLLTMCASVAACKMGRFPTCENDAECAGREDGKTAPFCFDLRCVACRSDEDCGAGKMCNSAKECKGLGGDGVPSAERAADAAAPPSATP